MWDGLFKLAAYFPFKTVISSRSERMQRYRSERFVFILLFLFSSSIFACTDFQVLSKDGSVVIGRAMEYPVDTASEIVVHPKGIKLSSKAPNGKAGLSWQSKYGYIATSAFERDIVADGMNEEGLSVGFLLLPETQYQVISEKDAKKAIRISDLGDWLLGNFATVKEVKNALKTVKVWGDIIQKIQMVAPVHIAVHDKEGHNLVVEYIKGEPVFYDNPMGVLTNGPTFDWHLQNIRNYVNLTPVNVQEVELAGVKVMGTGHGSGMVGLPGDLTPPGRFIRTLALVQTAQAPKNKDEAVNLANHVLNTVDIPYGVIKEKMQNSYKPTDYTQWVVIKDLQNQVLYYRSYEDVALKAVHLKSLDLASGAPVKVLTLRDRKFAVNDVTNELKIVNEVAG